MYSYQNMNMVQYMILDSFFGKQFNTMAKTQFEGVSYVLSKLS